MDEDRAELRRIIIFHARSGIEPLQFAQRLYTARYCLPLMSFCLVQLCDALLSYSPQAPPASETIEFCLRALQQTNAGSALCGPLQALFVQRVAECGIPIPKDLEELVDSVDEYTVDDILDCCTRLSYTEPLDQIVRYIDPVVSKDWNEEWETQIVGHKRGPEQLQIDNILND